MLSYEKGARVKKVRIQTKVYMYEAERINTPGQKEVNELDYEFLEAERKVDAFF